MTAASLEFPALRDPRYPVHKIAALLEPYLRAIVGRLQPEKIILFGSQAYGQPDQHSDVDLLVVRRGIRAEIESNVEIREVMQSTRGANLPFTILSRTPERIEEELARGSWFQREISEKGVLLYAA